LNIEGKCYTRYDRTAYDCALGADAILELEKESQQEPECNAEECDGGGA
jgi:hypothetical protein